MTPERLLSPGERLRRADPIAFRAFVRVKALLMKRSEWLPEYALGLSSLAPALSAYLRTAREARRETIGDAMRKELEALAEEQRQTARAALVQFRVIDEELSRFGAVNPAGEDELIAALCAPLPEPVT
jgi:hypothetical protein